VFGGEPEDQAMTRDWTAAQEQTCNKYKCALLEADGNSKVGLALGTVGKLPINGLRHPPTENMSGWFIWCGTELSEDREFFAPLHVWHLEEKCLEVLEFLGLPAGYRFLLAGDYVDVWFDPELLTV
jgi:hypothetical protein